MFDIINTTLSAAVADNGTFTVSYPAGKSAATYTGAHKHKMAALQTVYNAPVDFTLTFGASSITVTYLGSTTLPAGTDVVLQVDRIGTDDRQPDKVIVNDRVVPAPVKLLDLGSPATADANGVAESQTVTGAGTAFVLDGVLVDGGVAIMDTPRNIVAAWTNTAVLTITGTDVDDNVVVEKSASGTSHTGKKAFKTVTSVTTSATVTSATVGTGVVLGLPAYVPSTAYVLQELQDGADVIEAIVTVTDSTGSSGSHDDTLADGLTLTAITENSGAIGGSNDGNMPDLTATYVALDNVISASADAQQDVEATTVTDGTMTGSADGALEIIGSTSGGDVSGAIMNNFKDIQAALVVANANDATIAAAVIQLAADVVNLRAGVRECAAKLVTVATDLGVQNQNDSDLAQKVIEIVAALNKVNSVDGTFVAGVATAPSGTTGDTRGTYSPVATPDGTKAFSLLVAMPDPGNQGTAQYTG